MRSCGPSTGWPAPPVLDAYSCLRTSGVASETAFRWPSRGVYESVATRPRTVFARARRLRCARMATILQASPPPSASEAPDPPRGVLGWLSDPRRALLAAVLILTGAVGLDALSDPDVWWHIRLGDWIIAHHQIPTGELFAYTAFGNPLVAHEWLARSEE